MKNTIIYSVLFFSILLGNCGFEHKNNFPEYKGPYLGQKPPGNVPKLFLPGLISTHDTEGCIAFLDDGRVCVYANRLNGVMYLCEKAGRWTEPQELLIQNESKFFDFSAGPDGKTLYLQSRRPIAPDDTLNDTNIWAVEWTNSSWGEPYPIPQPANTDEYSELYPAVAEDGSLYFFNFPYLNFAKPDAQMGDIYRSRLIQGEYTRHERLSAPVNSDYHELDPVIASDKSFLIFGSGRPGGYGLLDLYITFMKEDGDWTHAFNMGPDINPLCSPARMSITPDGKYFFFLSNKPHDTPKGNKIKSQNVDLVDDYDVYWQSTAFIKILKSEYFEKKCAADVIKDYYTENGLISAVAVLENLYINNKYSYYFEMSELMKICADMINSGKPEDADHFYNSLLKILPDKKRIMQGYSMTCLLHNQREKGFEHIKEMWLQFPSMKNEHKLVDIMTYQISDKSGMAGLLDLHGFVVQEFPESSSAHYRYADALERTGNKEDALKHCRESLSLKPDFQRALELLEKLEK